MSFAETFSRQLLNKDADMNASEDISTTTKTLVNRLNGISANKRADGWPVPDHFAPLQTFPKHILHFTSIYHKDKGVFKIAVIYLCHNGSRHEIDFYIKWM